MSSWDYVLLDPEKEPRSSLLRPVTLAGMITFVLLGTGGWLSRSIFSDIEGKSGFGGPTGPVPHSSAQTAGEDGKPGGPGLLQLVGLEEDCPGVQTRMLEPTPFQSLVQDGVVLQWQWDHKGQLRFRTYQGEQKPQLKSRTNQEGKEGKEGKEGGSDRGEWVAGCDKCFRGQHRLRPAAQKLCQVGTSTAVCASHAALARDATFPVFAEQTVREAGISLKGGRKRLRTLPRPGPTSTVLQFGQLMQYRNNTRGEMVFRTINSTRSKYQWRSACLACFKTKDGLLKNGKHRFRYQGLDSRLCDVHGREFGLYTGVQSPCRDCPPEAKRQASYRDEHGNPARLCAEHARAVGSYEVQNPCRDCPPDNKKQAAYMDELGNPYRLCAEHAREAGSHHPRPRELTRELKKEKNIQLDLQQ